jgi:hypothetical protein
LGYETEAFITSIASLGTFNQGDTISLQFLGAWDDCAQGTVPNWEIDSVQFNPPLEDRRTAPTFTNPLLPADAAVVQGRSHTLQVAVTGQVSLQWYKDSAPIPGATDLTYTIPSMSPADAGQYFAQAINSIGSSDSRMATVTLVTDTVPPVLLFAYSDPADLKKFSIIVNEPVCVESLCIGTALDEFTYSIELLDGSQPLGVATVTVTSGTNITLVAAQDRTLGQSYRIRVDISDGIADVYGNLIPKNTPASEIIVSEPLVFQESMNGYNGTADTELSSGTPATALGANLFVTVDNNTMSHGLLRFDNIFGPGTGQIPLGATIISARLTLTHGNGTGPNGNDVNLHRMLVPWDESTATYDSLVAGVSADGVEARTAADAVIVSTGITQSSQTKITTNVTASLQAWANGEANYGWAFLPTGSDGYRWDSSESTVAGSQPSLEVLFTVPACAAVSISQQPAASTTVNEGGAFTLSVSAISQGCPATFQWTLGGADIPGATNSSYTVASANPTVHAGDYRVRIANAAPSTVTSEVAVVTVNPDTTRPTLVRAVGGADGSTITLSFSERMNASSALSPGSYALAPSLAIISAVETNGTNVILTTAPRVFPTTYTLTISGLTDNSIALNPLNPSPTIVSIVSDTLVITPWGSSWKYETNNLDASLTGGTPWYATGYDDSLWPSGNGLAGFETSAGVVALFPTPIATPLVPTSTDVNQVTHYFRKSVTLPSIPAGTRYVIAHLIDDGAVFYVDGVESSRYNMGTASPVLFAEKSPASIEAVFSAERLPAGAGTHLIAIEVHQGGATSSDVLFGAEIRAVVEPSLAIKHNADGSVTASWTAGASWELVSATSPAGPYTAVAGNPPSPVTITAGTLAAATFYQLRYTGR